jgi:peroxiredoxin
VGGLRGTSTSAVVRGVDLRQPGPRTQARVPLLRAATLRPCRTRTLARNGALAVVAAFVVWQGRDDAGPSALGWIGELNTTQLIAVTLGLMALVLLAGQWWALLHVLRQNGRLLVRVEALEARLGVADAAARSGNGAQQAAGLPVSSVAPGFSLSGLHGETLTLESLRSAGKPILLLFTDPDCGPCTAMFPEIGRWQEEHAEKLTVSLVRRGEVEENRAKAQEHGLTNVLLQEDWEVSKAYRVNGTPSAVLVEADGTIASVVMGGADNISALVAHAVGERAQLPMHHPQEAQEGQPCPNCGKIHAAAPTVPAAKKVGEEAPEVSLQNLEGNEVSLEDFRGEETLVLFWNPGCGFCQQMLPDLREWEQNPPEDAPNLLVVSAGTEEASREQDLSSTVVLDQNFAVGRAFGASGTPSAVLVDAEGKVASDIVVGASAVLQMAGASRTGS